MAKRFNAKLIALPPDAKNDQAKEFQYVIQGVQILTDSDLDNGAIIQYLEKMILQVRGNQKAEAFLRGIRAGRLKRHHEDILLKHELATKNGLAEELAKQNAKLQKIAKEEPPQKKFVGAGAGVNVPKFPNAHAENVFWLRWEMEGKMNNGWGPHHPLYNGGLEYKNWKQKRAALQPAYEQWKGAEVRRKEAARLVEAERQRKEQARQLKIAEEHRAKMKAEEEAFKQRQAQENFARLQHEAELMLRRVNADPGDHLCKFTNNGAMMMFCPGCGEMHMIPTDAGWSHNNDPIEPHFKGNSIYGKKIYKSIHDASKNEICHFYLKKGVLYFWSDCTHRFQNRAVPMVPVKYWFKKDAPEPKPVASAPYHNLHPLE